MKTIKLKSSYNLSDAEVERLAILMEECAEVQQVIGKILRHGWNSHNPFDKDKTPNRLILTRELGDLMFAIDLMVRRKDIDRDEIHTYAGIKNSKIEKYLHFNTAFK